MNLTPHSLTQLTPETPALGGLSMAESPRSNEGREVDGAGEEAHS